MKIIKITHIDSLMQNSYLIKNGNSCVLIDCGCTIDELKTEYKKECKDKLKIDAVLLTHLHFDHICGLKDFQKEFNCPIFYKCGKANYFTAPNLNASEFFIAPLAYVPKNTIEIKDETPIDLIGLKFYPIFTPGHTSTSICYLVLNNLFSGDTLFFNSVGRTDLEDCSEAELTNSINKLNNYKFNYVFAGHGVPFKRV